MALERFVLVGYEFVIGSSFELIVARGLWSKSKERCNFAVLGIVVFCG